MLAFELAKQGLDVDESGWIRVNDQLQSLSHPWFFAAGDCCTIVSSDKTRETPPKAGVYAVRSGPILIENLTRSLSALQPNRQPTRLSSQLVDYEPQDDFLKLLVCGDGTAIGFRFGIVFHGKWVWEMKDAIDRHFMDLFDVSLLPKVDVQGTSSQDYDTSQYDAKMVAASKVDKVYEPKAAAKLLQRTDDDVDYIQAWAILREMASNEEYQDQVLEYVHRKETVPS